MTEAHTGFMNWHFDINGQVYPDKPTFTRQEMMTEKGNYFNISEFQENIKETK